MHVIAVPVKPLARAKHRLAPLLSPAERSMLTLALFDGVLEAAVAQSSWEPWVVSSAPEVLRRAARRGAWPVHDHGGSLLGAVRQVENELRRRDDKADLAVLLADLPLITPPALAEALERPGSVVAVAADSNGGTNFLLRRPGSIIPARFGRSSFEKHCSEAYRAGVSFHEVTSARLAFDLDTPLDLARLLGTAVGGPALAACLDMGLATRLSAWATG
jgi:2-phospho-L-lactate guanylyltransferase